MWIRRRQSSLTAGTLVERLEWAGGAYPPHIVPLHVVPRQLQPSRGFPLQLTQFGEQESIWHCPLTHEDVAK